MPAAPRAATLSGKEARDGQWSGASATAGEARRIAILPTTRLGRWSVRLAIGFIVFVLAWRIMPGGAAPGFLLDLDGGVVALVAIFRRGERAIAVFAAILPLALVGAFVLAELIVGHD